MQMGLHGEGAKADFEVEGCRVRLLHDGARVFPAMLEAIRQARREVLLEMYWFDDGRIGTRFADALIERAQAGISVRVLYDAVGSFGTDDSHYERMARAGVKVLEYNPIAPWHRRFRIDRLKRRNHRKMLIVDGALGFTGGVNIGDAWLPVEDGGEGWRDDVVCLEGPAVQTMRGIFRHGWYHVEKEGFGQRGERFLPRRGRRLAVLANHHFGERRAIRSAYLHQIAGAREQICITNSYFVPDRVIRNALAAAAAAGVRVQLMVPGQNDIAAVYYATRKLYPWFIKRGIEVYEWMPTVLHSKTAVIDSWSTVGTYNLDYLSWLSNLEVVIAIEDEAFGQAMRHRFAADLAHARRIDEAILAERSWKEMGLERLFFFFRKFL